MLVFTSMTKKHKKEMPHQVGHDKLDPSAKFETGVFDSLFQGGLVHVILVVPLHPEFLACHVGLGRYYSVQHPGGLFHASLAVAAGHTLYTVNRDAMFVLAITMLVTAIAVFMFAAAAFMVTFTATAVTAATLMGKLRVNHK